MKTKEKKRQHFGNTKKTNTSFAQHILLRISLLTNDLSLFLN